MAGMVSCIHAVAVPSGMQSHPPAAHRGHASENPELPKALAERNIRFLGPGSAAMAALGDKV